MVIDNVIKITTIVGARPQFIKAAVLSRLAIGNKNIKEVIIHTGQHFDNAMSNVFFEELSIPEPHYNLGVNSGSHGEMTGRMMEKIEGILKEEDPNWVIIYGDTNSTLAGALAAKKLNIKLAHVEAGLRSFNDKMPEEVNRILSDRISDLLFCPTTVAVNNLMAEGYSGFKSKIIQSGDIMLDASMYYSGFSRKPSFRVPDKFVLCTIHRAENTDDILKLEEIFLGLENISNMIEIVLPLHPRTKSSLENINYDFINSKILFVPPVGYLEMIWLLQNCKIVITDSGGLQKEAFFFKKQCVTLRDETEWTELIDLGVNQLAGHNEEHIFTLARSALQSGNKNIKSSLYGDGDAGSIILNEIVTYEEQRIS